MANNKPPSAHGWRAWSLWKIENANATSRHRSHH